MFKAVIEKGARARSEQLRREWEDLVLRIAGADESFQLRMVDRINAMSQWLTDRCISLDNKMSQEEKQSLAKELRAFAQASFHKDLAGSYAAAVVCCYVESETLPGFDAVFVRDHSESMIVLARAQCRGLEAACPNEWPPHRG